MGKCTARVRRERQYNHLYREHPLNSLERCLYCGEPGACLDHVPALVSVDSGGISNDIPHLLVLSCLHCNLTLGDKRIHTLEARQKYLAFALRAKYRRVLSREDWSYQEMEALLGVLRIDIRHQGEVRRWIHRRLEYLEGVPISVPSTPEIQEMEVPGFFVTVGITREDATIALETIGIELPPSPSLDWLEDQLQDCFPDSGFNFWVDSALKRCSRRVTVTDLI